MAEKKIILDWGHGGDDPGACAVHMFRNTYPDGYLGLERLPNGMMRVREAEIVAAVGGILKDQLEKTPGMEVVLTRQGREYVSLADRIGIITREKPDAVLSIHANAGGGSGTEAWYQEGDESSKEFALTIMRGFAQWGWLPNRGIKAGSIRTRTNWYTFGSILNDVLLEIAFVDNPEDAAKMLADVFEIAKLLSDTIVEYLKPAVRGSSLPEGPGNLAEFSNTIIAERSQRDGIVGSLSTQVSVLEQRLISQAASYDGIIGDALHQKDVANTLKKHIEAWAWQNGMKDETMAQIQKDVKAELNG